MNLLEHAKNELSIAGLLDSKDEMQQLMNQHILKIIEEFENFGHSGFSAGYALSQLIPLMDYLPLTPLTGNDDEWEKAAFNLWQNKRCSRVFKTPDGAYDIDGYYFKDQNGNTFTNHCSSKPVIFPYIPQKPQMIEVFDHRKD